MHFETIACNCKMFSILLILISLFFFNFIKYWEHFQLAFKIPGPFFIPFIGCVEIIAKMKPEDITNIVNYYRNKYKKTFRFVLGPNVWVFLHTPNEIREALNNSTLRRAADFQQLKLILGEGLLLSEELKWNTRRRALTAAFHVKLLNQFAESISNHAKILVQNFEKHSEECIEISEYIFHCILDAVCETSMGTKINSQSDPNCQYAKAYHEAFHILFQRMINPLLGFDFIFNRLEFSKQLSKSIKIIHDMTDKVIKTRREHYNYAKLIEENNSNNFLRDEFEYKPKMAMLDILLSININGEYLTDKDIKDEVNTFLFAGVDTTKSAMCFAIYNLAKYKKIQDQIYDEIISITETASTEMIFTLEILKSMKILDQFLKESLRLYTVVPLTGRQTTIQTKIGDNIYPKNTSIWINMYGLAHDEKYFPNPYEFKIDRFEDGNEIDQYTYLPFSAGPHNCIGKRYAELILKIILIHIIRNFEIFLKNPNEKLELISEMVLSARQGFNLIFKKRK